MAVTAKSADVSGETPYVLVCGRLQVWASTLMMVIVCSSETSVALYIITQRRIPETTVLIGKTFFICILDRSTWFCSCVRCKEI